MLRANDGTLAVLDASVAVRWLVPEIGSKEAAALMERPIAWIAPQLLITEFSAALRRKVVGNELRVEHAVQAIVILKQAVVDGIIELANDDDLVPAALMLALTLNHKLPDCMYLALAERDGAAIATADLALARCAEQRGASVFVIPSA